MKKTHGGARANAGRKPRAIPREAITVRLEPEDAERFREICRKRGISQAQQVARWVKGED